MIKIGLYWPIANSPRGDDMDRYVAKNARESAEVAEVYRQTALAAGKEPQVVMMRDAWVDYTLEDAARVYVLEVMDASGFTSKIVPMPSTNSVG